MFQDIVTEFTALVGFAALLSVAINILKHFKVVKDGAAPRIVAIVNGVALLALIVYRAFFPSTPIEWLDSTLGQIATILSYVLAFIVQIAASRLTHFTIRGTPLIGFSYTFQRLPR